MSIPIPKKVSEEEGPSVFEAIGTPSCSQRLRAVVTALAQPSVCGQPKSRK